MNSLNLLSANLGIGGKSKQRSRSVGDVIRTSSERPSPPKRSVSQHPNISGIAAATQEEDWSEKAESSVEPEIKREDDEDEDRDAVHADVPLDDSPPYGDERQPLLLSEKAAGELPVHLELTSTSSTSLLRRILAALRESIRWVLAKLLAPGMYLLACFRSDDGRYSALAPLRRRRTPPGGSKVPRNGRNSTAHAVGLSASPAPLKGSARASASRASYGTAHDEAELRAQSSSDDAAAAGGPPRRSVRIKTGGERQREAQRSKRRSQQRTASEVVKPGAATQEELAAAELKSPTSPASSLGLAKYAHAPRPPRPLIPRRQPSYAKGGPLTGRPSGQKTLVLDLDETLIHSLAKGGRMGSGHMVEVRLAHTLAAGGAPQHPILYYVHKRPHCDDFLRKVSQWYNLVAFTASVQEYADPVIDWLEQERKFFSARYYRQHCTFRNGAYIKDLSAVEPDLSRVMILDNSPLSYIFHEANAIPIEGWINDPTDNDLLHLVPLLEGLQHVTDVRALLALRQGEVEADAA